MDVPHRRQLITTHAVKTYKDWTELKRDVSETCAADPLLRFLKYTQTNKGDDSIELSALNLAWSDICQGLQIIKI